MAAMKAGRVSLASAECHASVVAGGPAAPPPATPPPPAATDPPHGNKPNIMADPAAPLAAQPSSALQDVARQLSVQIGFSNDLMAQVQALEAQHSATAKAAAERQALLKAAVSAAEMARGDAAAAKRKLAVSQVRSRAARAPARRRAQASRARAAHLRSPLPPPCPPHSTRSP